MSVLNLDRLISRRRDELDRPVLVAVDGRSGVGKSTFAAQLAERHGGAVVTADDFWSGGPEDLWASLAPHERGARAIDWRRLRTEVLEPLLAARPAQWRAFDWETGHGLSKHELLQKAVPVIVLDGAYSTRPELGDLIDVTVLLRVDESTRRKRLRAREGERFMSRWHAVWDPAEDYYFAVVRPAQSFDIVLTIK